MSQPDLIGDLWAAAKTAGPFGTLLMLVMWHLERKERQRLQKIVESFLPAVTATGRIIRGMSRAIAGNGIENGDGDG